MPDVAFHKPLLPPLAALALCLGTLLAGCSQAASGNAAAVSGDADAGAALIVKLGCGSCHEIPGIADARGMVGPPLEHMASRQFIAGMLRNNPDNMVRWVRFPQQVVPGNAMPDLAINESDARQIAAYLATLK